MLTIPLMGELEADLGMELNNVTASAIRLNVTYRLTAAQSTDDTTVAMGIIWATDRAIAAGGVALPDPSADHADWMFHDIRTLVGESGIDQDSMPRNGFLEIRNNSMRKQRENGSSLVALFRVTLLQATSVQIFVGGRTLFLLP